MTHSWDGVRDGETVGSTVGTLDVGAIDGEIEGIAVDGYTVGETVGSVTCEHGQNRSRSP